MLKIFNKARDPISSYTHFLGAVIFGFCGLLITIKSALSDTDTITVLSLFIFTASLISLYTSSCLYHFIPSKSKYYTNLKKLDHSMIFVLIAGTYTPVVIKFYPPQSGMVFLIIIWLIALSGIGSKLFWINAPRKLSTLLYLALGWALIFYFKPIITLPFDHIFYLLLGGIAYSIGAIIYARKKPDITQEFGFHELFHIFVLAGSFFHFLFVALFIA